MGVDLFTLQLAKKYAEKLVEGAGAIAGKSAYEIAKKNGYSGSEEEWLQSLKGEPGVSPAIEITEDKEGNHTVIIKDEDGSHSFVIKDGKGGGNGEVISFNGRKGDIVPQLGDYDVEKIGVLDDNGEPILKANGKPINVLEYMNAHFEVKKTDAQKEAEQKKSEVDLSDYYTKEETLESVRNEIGTITYDDKETITKFESYYFEPAIYNEDDNEIHTSSNYPNLALSDNYHFYIPHPIKDNTIIIQHDLEDLYILEYNVAIEITKKTKVTSNEPIVLSEDTCSLSLYVVNPPKDKSWTITSKFYASNIAVKNKLIKSLNYNISSQFMSFANTVMKQLIEIASFPDAIPKIINNLLSDSEDSALSAKQGKILNDKIEALRKKQVMTASGDVTLSPSTFYVWNNDVATLNIAFDDANSDTFIQEYHFMFNSGSTATVLTLPTSVKKPSDFKIEANKIYEISILENYLSYQSWSK